MPFYQYFLVPSIFFPTNYRAFWVWWHLSNHAVHPSYLTDEKTETYRSNWFVNDYVVSNWIGTWTHFFRFPVHRVFYFHKLPSNWLTEDNKSNSHLTWTKEECGKEEKRESFQSLNFIEQKGKILSHVEERGREVVLLRIVFKPTVKLLYSLGKCLHVYFHGLNDSFKVN